MDINVEIAMKVYGVPREKINDASEYAPYHWMSLKDCKDYHIPSESGLLNFNESATSALKLIEYLRTNMNLFVTCDAREWGYAANVYAFGDGINKNTTGTTFQAAVCAAVVNYFSKHSSLETTHYWSTIGTIYTGYPSLQEEINKLNDDIYKSMQLAKENRLLAPRKCQHEMKSYVGLTETYNYCTKCDHKDNS